MEYAISVIVPIYKAENYLPKCIESILSQTFHNFQLILVDDGSPDLSGEICDRYAQLDTRIEVIHKQNGGVMSARKCGILSAQGIYSIQIDPDDWVEVTLLEDLYQQAIHEDADMVIGLTVNAYKNQHQVFEYPILREEDFRDFALIDLISCGGIRSDNPLCVNIHPHLYKRSLLEKYLLRFVDT